MKWILSKCSQSIYTLLFNIRIINVCYCGCGLFISKVCVHILIYLYLIWCVCVYRVVYTYIMIYNSIVVHVQYAKDNNMNSRHKTKYTQECGFSQSTFKWANVRTFCVFGFLFFFKLKQNIMMICIQDFWFY